MVTPAAADASVDRFESGLHGTLIRPDDDEYDDARAVWNGMIDKRPAIIARPTGAADVISCVEFAREAELPLAVRGGGHNVAGSAVCDDGLVIDLSEMDAVRVDLDAKTAWVQGGATWADVDHETQAFGLAAPGGVVSDTGVAGLTLGGGIGHLRCAFGLSCDNLRSVELVTADGELVRARTDEHPELFWGLRGGGGNFGVVTAFEFELHPVGPEVAYCLTVYHADDLRAVLDGYREVVESAPDDVSTLTFAGELPDDEMFDDDVLHESKIAVMGCHAGEPASGEVDLEAFRTLAEPIADFSGTMSYVDLQRLLDEDYPDGMRYYWKSLYLDDLSASAIDRIDYWAEAAPSPLSTVDVWQLGGAITDVGLDESAFAGRHAPFLLGVEANWKDPKMDDDNVAWVRDCLDDMRQFSDGSVYFNFPGFLEDNDATMETTFGAAYERLQAVKDEWDPENVFSLNQNVKPSGNGTR